MSTQSSDIIESFTSIFNPATLSVLLAQGEEPVRVFRAALQTAKDRLKQHFLHTPTSASQLVQARVKVVDSALVQAWQYFQLHVTPFSLVAVGGYGRGELHPSSDIDLLVIAPDDVLPANYPADLERFLVFLWDIGLEVGHSVRTVTECVTAAQEDITIATNLMESRLLVGVPQLFDAMRAQTAPPQLWPSKAFFEAKWHEQIQRHHKYHDTAYNLEPNVKEGPGGLRDIHMVGWVAKRHFAAQTLHDLVTHQFLTEGEYLSLMEGQEFLWQVRFALHVLTGRREDRLLFDHQRALAKQFGFQDTEHRLGVEQFMHKYYRTITELRRLNEMLLQLFQEAILFSDIPATITPINRRFQARNGFIEVCEPRTFQRYPFSLLEIFLLLQQHPELKGVRASTIRLIRDHRHLIDEKFRNDLRNRSLFMEIFRQPLGLTHELRRMNAYGVLAAYLPVFGAIVGQMQYDLFHVYTVDEHTLMVMRNLRRFTVAEFKLEFPVCSTIVSRLPKPEILWLAGLFHDIAKGRGGDHSELGAEEATRFCLHHGMSAYDARFVAWLVRNHLIMSMTAQRKDISDPEVITAFARLVGDQVHLEYLYLLTVADIRGTNPALWNGWKNALLLELYTATSRALRRGLERPIDQGELLQEVQAQALSLLSGEGKLTRAEIMNYWSEVGDEYFLRHLPDEIVWHTQEILKSPAPALPLVAARQQSTRGGTEILVYTHDQGHTFAMVTRALDQLDLTVVDARIHTARSGHTLDSYIVLEASGDPLHSVQRIEEIIRTLRHHLRNPADKKLGQRPIPRQYKHFPTPTEIHFALDERNQRTVMELITADRPGLLSRVGRAFMECGACLKNAKIATMGARVEDIFYVTDKDNRPLQESQWECLRLAIRRYVDELQ